MRTLKIAMIGAGNVASHLTPALAEKGHDICCVYSRTRFSAKTLADLIGCRFTTKIDDIDSDADIYIISVSDAVIKEVASHPFFKDKFVVHTSGAFDINCLHVERAGVLYPLQTMSKEKEIDFKQIPFCVEASFSQDYSLLMQLAQQLTHHVYNIDSEQRKVLHVAAVFACNFSNYMYMIAEDILSKKDIPLDILKPLIKETALKAMDHKPAEVQTGPAIRGDENTIGKHLQYLEGSEYQSLYRILTESIQDKNGN